MISTDSIQQRAPRYYVISIGINHYQDSFWSRLRWPASDAQRVAAALGKDTGYQLVTELIINKDATLQHIYQRLNAINQKVTAHDIVVLYISSHGSLDTSQNGQLEKLVVVHDTKSSKLLDTGLSHSYLRHWLDGLCANRKLMIVATCNSGLGKSRVPDEIRRILNEKKGEEKLVSLEDVSEGLLILSASSKFEAARESASLKSDIYTYFFLKALDTHDRNQDGIVSAMEAHDYARDRTWQYSKGQQRPTAEAQLIGKADIPIQGRKKNDGLPILEAYHTAMKGFSIGVNGGRKGELPSAFALAPDDNIIEIYTPGSKEPIAVYQVKAKSGDTISLGDITKPSPFELRLRYAQSAWDDLNLKRINGQSWVSHWALEGLFRHHSWVLGLRHSIEGEQKGAIKPHLKATLNYQQLEIFGGYEYPLGSEFSFAGNFGLGQQSMVLNLNDGQGNQLEFEKDSLLMSLEARLNFHPASGPSFGFFVSRSWSEWDFDPLGVLRGNRWDLGLDVGYRFGGRARRLR